MRTEATRESMLFGISGESADEESIRLAVARVVIDMVDEALLVADVDGWIRSWNQAAEELTGYSGVELAQLKLAAVLDHLPTVAVLQELPVGERRSASWRGEVSMRRSGGAQRVISVRHKVVHSDSRTLLRQVLLLAGPAQPEAAGRVSRLVDPDQLTGLQNRGLLREDFLIKLKEATRSGHRIALLVIDVDGFKSVNDWVGHAGGDLFLQHVADRLSSAIAGAGSICRLAGNEFLATMTRVESVSTVTAMVDRIRAAMDCDFTLNGHAFRRTVSIGIALCPDDGSDFDELARKADMAKHLARRSGSNSVLFHADKMTKDLEHRRSVERALVYGVRHGEIFMRYQPQVDLITGQIVGLEALARWAWPGHGEVAPDVFIPLAEESGLIIELGPETFRLVCEQARIWHDAGIAVPISVNVSPIEIALGEVDIRILEIIEHSGVPPHMLSIEITETGLIDSTLKTESAITNLRDSSVGLSIDDFLTGYSNFAYLRNFRATQLKIDRSFVTDIDTRSDNREIVGAAIKMATALGIATVAEGVETEGEAAALRELGCSIGQGYLMARPLLATEVEQMLTRGRCGAQPSITS